MTLKSARVLCGHDVFPVLFWPLIPTSEWGAGLALAVRITIPLADASDDMGALAAEPPLSQGPLSCLPELPLVA